MRKKMNFKSILSHATLILLFCATVIGMSHMCVSAINTKVHDDPKVKNSFAQQAETSTDDMIKSYNDDQLIYDQYKDSANSYEHAWADEAKIRANNTAFTYNQFILKRRHLGWRFAR